MASMMRAVSWVVLLLSVVGVAQYEREAKSPGGSVFPWPKGKRAALSLSFDDARPSQVDNGLPVFARHRVRATFYVSPGSLAQRLDGWKKAVEQGHEIGNHSMTHPCSGNFDWSRGRALEDYTLADIRREMTDANEAIRRSLGVVPKTFAYPCGQKFVGRGVDLKSYVPLVASLFGAGRGWLDEAPNDPAFCDPAQLLGVPSDNLTFQAIKPIVDDAIARGRWLVLAGHDIAEKAARQTTLVPMLDDLLAYVTEPPRGVWVETIAGVAEHIRRARSGSGASNTNSARIE